MIRDPGLAAPQPGVPADWFSSVDDMAAAVSPPEPVFCLHPGAIQAAVNTLTGSFPG